MKFPAGTDGGTISNPQDEGFIRELMSFVGAIEIETGSGHGFILTEYGKLIAAYFRSDQGIFRGKEALTHMTLDSNGVEEQTFNLRVYNPSEFTLAVRISGEEKLLLSDMPTASSGETPAKRATPVVPSDLLDETRLRKIISQPGVIAVSAFFEGFPVLSMGNEDFEHVAASAEDFWRAGMKIAQEMKIGNLDQLILETAQNKFIIAPCGDLHLCIFTTAEAQLGLIRVVLKSIQKEITG
ncbi:MAG: roadblock/LC7 domain-containing protein [Methanoregula sp.]|nr:roadblock/LC7 domain-containing protein [Methanoregula sp.]